MKPRVEKKLSKKLAQILKGISGFEDIWVDEELDLFRIHYSWHGKGDNGELTTKQKRDNFNQKVRVNHMPSVGGHADYWGEATEIYSVFEAAREVVYWNCFEYSQTDNARDDFDAAYVFPVLAMKLTGKNVIMLAKKYAAKIRKGEQSGTWLKDSNVNGGKRQGGV